ncbi:MAG: hypothetical protein ACREM1_14155 [Longimicrobiales bacterium]
MDCGSARELLWPPERPRLAEGQTMAARRHMQSCRACQTFLEWDDALVALHSRSETAPPSRLRERVLRRIAETRASRAGHEKSAGWFGAILPAWRTAIAAATVATVVLVVAAVGYGLWSSQPKPVPDPVFIEDYLRRAVSEDRITTSDPERVARFLTRELGRSARPLSSPALVIVSAEVCLLDGVRGAMILYEKDGRLISHYLIPRASDRTQAPRPRPVRSDGVGLVTWGANAFDHALLAEMPADSLIALVADVGAT